MARQQTATRSLKAIAGAILLPVGLLLLLANLDEMAAPFGNSFTSNSSSLGAVMELGLAGLRAVEAYFFDPASFQSGLHHVLLSFWPLILVIIGATLLQNAICQRFANRMLARNFPSEEYESES